MIDYGKVVFMIRTNFDKESMLVEQDFLALIERYGGKTAGLMLFQKLIDRLGSEKLIKIPPYYPSTTELYNEFEQIVKANGGVSLFQEKDGNWKELDKITPLLLTSMFNTFKELLDEMVIEALRHFQKIGMMVDRKTLFHARISSTVEDFIDDRYWAVMPTFAGLPLFEDFYGWFHSKKIKFIEKVIIYLFYEFYCLKQQPSYELPSNASAGVLIHKTLDNTASHGLITTAYSAFPEPENRNGPVYETFQASGYFCKDLGFNSPFKDSTHYQLFIDGKMIPGYSLEPGRKMYLEGINRLKEGLLDTRQRKILDEIVLAFSKRLGYQVNLELATEKPKSRIFHGFQLRPVPVLSADRPVKKLHPPEKGQKLLAKTPFVFGNFQYTLPLWRPTRRFGYTKNHQFEEPIILSYDRGRDIMGFAKMPNVMAIINFQEGRALSHEYEYKPEFPFRQNFHYLGVPMLSDFQRFFSIGEKKDFENYGFEIFPCPITIEADGRFGQISISETDAEKFGLKTFEERIGEMNIGGLETGDIVVLEVKNYETDFLAKVLDFYVDGKPKLRILRFINEPEWKEKDYEGWGIESGDYIIKEKQNPQNP